MNENFKYNHDGWHGNVNEFVCKDIEHNGRTGVFIYVDDLTDMFRVKNLLKENIVPLFEQNKIGA